MRTSNELRLWTCDDGNAEIDISAATARKAAESYVADGDWGEIAETTYISVYVWPEETDEDDVIDDRELFCIPLFPPAPDCTAANHDWRSPIEILGGCEENPGCFSSGGSTKDVEVCAHAGCGWSRTSDHWAQDRSTGEQGLESVEYEWDDAAADWTPEED